MNDDPELLIAVRKVQNVTSRMTSNQEKADYISRFVHNVMPNDPDNNGYTDRIVGQEVTLGQLIEDGQGVCRHRSLLFKILADNADVPSALVRGHYESPYGVGPHAWNEITNDQGQVMIVDVMHQKSLQMHDNGVGYYNHLDQRPMYQQTAKPRVASHQQQRSVSNIDTKWIAVDMSNGQNAMYCVLDGKSNAEQAMIHAKLSDAGIDYIQKTSSLNGGCEVLAVSGAANLRKLDTLCSSSAPANSEPVQTQPLNRNQQRMRRGG
jgi:hypothetical protein